jgi:hypothetical protein
MTLTPEALITLAVPPETGPPAVGDAVGVGDDVGVGVALPQPLIIRVLKIATVKSINRNFFIDAVLPPLLIQVI